jgi:phage-related protein
MLVPALSAITTFFVQNPGLAKAMVIGILAVGAAMVALNVALAITTALASPWIALALGIGVAVAAMAAGLIYAYKTSDTFRTIVDAAFSAVKTIAQTLFGWFQSNWPLLLGIITGPVGLAAVLVIKYWSQIQSATQGAWNAIRSLTTAAWNAIQSFISSVAGAISGAVSSAWSAVRNATSTAWGGVRSVVTDVVGDVKSAISGMGTWVSGWASGTFAAITSRVGSFFDRIADGARDAVASVQRNMNAVVNAVESIVGRIEGAAQSVANAIRRPINAVIAQWNSLAFPRVSVDIPKKKILGKTVGGGSFGFGPIQFPNISPLAKGGVVTSPTLALLGEAGPEAVVPLDRMPAPSVQVRVFIGDQELTSLVRTEIVSANTGLARALLAG